MSSMTLRLYNKLGSAEKVKRNEYMQKCAMTYTEKLYDVGKQLQLQNIFNKWITHLYMPYQIASTPKCPQIRGFSAKPLILGPF